MAYGDLDSVLTITAEQLDSYRQTAVKQAQQRQSRLIQHYQRGRLIAEQAAVLLKEQFGATQVILFGSMLDVQYIHLQSDLDLAVVGIDERDYLQALARLLDLSDFSIDLVELEHAQSSLLQVIQATGVSL